MRLASRVALATLLASLAAPATARAMGAVVSSPPGASSAIAVRVAVAASDEPGAPTAKWASVTVQGSATTFAWIVPARPGALLQLSPDAWLEALDTATAPRVVPPDPTPPCDFPGGSEVEGSFTPTTTTAPEAVAIATDRASLDSALANWGLSVTPELSSAIDAVLASGSDLVAMLFTDAPDTVVTRTFRVIDDAPVDVPLSLTAGGTNAIQVTAFALRSASPAFGTQPDLTVDPTAILWRSDGTSTYASARDAMLASNPGSWLLETTGPSLVSTPTTLPDGSTVPSLTAAYDALLANTGDAGTSDDLAVALGSGDAGAGESWLARGRTVIPAGSLGKDAPIATDASSDTIGPVLMAAGYAQTCEASTPAAPPQGATSGGGSPSNQGTSSGAAVDLGAGAAQVAADSSDGCGGDSSDSSGDGCGGDTSSSGSDSSDSDSGSGCSGSSSTDSSGDSGDGCSGSSDSSSGSECSVVSGGGLRRPRASGTSRFLVFFVGVAALCRRRGRRRPA